MPRGWDVSGVWAPSVWREIHLRFLFGSTRKQFVVGDVQWQLDIAEPPKDARRSIHERRDKLVELISGSEKLSPALGEEEWRISGD